MSFQTTFHTDPTVRATAPGRVNLLGEHTDYNDGFVLPTAIPQETIVELGFSPDDQDHFYSEELHKAITLDRRDDDGMGFGRYVMGCIRVLEQQASIPPLQVYVTSTVPMGAGLSSSAALEVALLRGLRSLLHLDLDDVKIAQLGQQAERQYAGVQCGIMDQMASSLANLDNLLFLDTRTLERQLVPLPAGTEILVIDSGVPRSLAGSGYNQRRQECEAAAQQLGVTALRDVQSIETLTPLPELLQRRARHVITENQRVLEARQGVSAERFGELMNASHISLRDDYEVSVPELDHLVELLQKTPDVFGARLTGAGFGGACVALVKTGKAHTIGSQVLSQYNASGHQGHLLVP